jgi:hypothetical protein
VGTNEAANEIAGGKETVGATGAVAAKLFDWPTEANRAGHQKKTAKMLQTLQELPASPQKAPKTHGSGSAAHGPRTIQTDGRQPKE